MDSRYVAMRAGVSQSTVSRVLNGHPSVRTDIRDKVLQIIEEVGYRPNAIARGLVTNKSNLLALVVSNISNPYYAELVEAVQEFCLVLNYQLLVWNSQRNVDLDERLIGSMVLERRVEGVIFASSLSRSPAVESLVRRGFPVVLTNRYIRGVDCDSVLVDNEGGAEKAVQHFLALGHRRIAFVQGHPLTTTNEDRLAGYKSALLAAGIEPANQLLFPGDFTYETACETGRAIAEMAHRPTAVLCADDTTAFGVMDGLYDARVAVPEEMAVIGFDDVAFARLRCVGLTTLRQPVREMARLSVELLVQRVTGEYKGVPRQVVHEAELIVRNTCGAKHQHS